MDEGNHRETVCRLCSDTMHTAKYSCIFGEQDESLGPAITAAAMMKEIADIEVMQDDHRSQHICSSCFERLDAAYELRMQIRAAETEPQPAAETVEDGAHKTLVTIELVRYEDLTIEEQDYECEYLEDFIDDVNCEIAEGMEKSTKERDVNEDLMMQLSDMVDEMIPEDVAEQKSFKFVMPTKNVIAKRFKFDTFEYLEINGERCCGCSFIATNKDELIAHSKDKHSHSYYPDNRYTCGTCYQKFPTEDKLDAHNRYFSVSDIFLCRLCDEVFHFKSLLTKHMEQTEGHQVEETGEYSEEKPSRRRRGFAQPLTIPAGTRLKEIDRQNRYKVYQLIGERCCACGTFYETSAELNAHVLQTHRTGAHAPQENGCSVCESQFESERELILHKEQRLYQSHIYECSKCTHLFPGRNTLLTHFRTCKSVDDKSVKQTKQNEGDNSSAVQGKTAAVVKYKKDASTSLKEYFCCFVRCKRAFETEQMLHEHCSEIHSGKRRENQLKRKERNPNFYACPICERGFETESKLQVHRTYKLLSMDHMCHHCGSRFFKMAALRAHKEIAHLALEPGFRCTTCGKGFRNRFILKQHMRIHGPDLQVPCASEDCKGVFRDEQLMKRHFRNVHGPHHPYQCLYCEKAHRTKESLDIHIRTHTGERPFPCRQGCDRRFAHGTDRVRHERAAHTFDRPHECTTCGMRFVRKREMMMHLQKHGKEG